MKRIMICLLVLLLTTVQMLPALASIKIPEPGSDFYYLDTANVLSEETEGEIYFCNQLLEEKCGAQIVIAALDSIAGADIYDFAVAMGNDWGIGSSEENNGFLLVLAIEEDDYYALPGRGLDDIFPASVIKKYYDDYLETDFAAKNYDAGVRKFFEAVFEKVADYYNANVSVQDGIEAYQAYDANGYGGVRGNQDDVPLRAETRDHRDEREKEFGFVDAIISFAGRVIGIVVIVIVLSMIFGGHGRRRGGIFFVPFFGSRPHHRPPRSPRPPRPEARNPHSGSGRRPPRGGGFGSFGGGHGGSGSFHSGFGGGHSGGGGGFGGGAGRGRH